MQETSFAENKMFLYKILSAADIHDLYIYILKTVSSILYIRFCLYYWWIIVRSLINQQIMPRGLRSFQLVWEQTKIGKTAQSGHLYNMHSFLCTKGVRFIEVWLYIRNSNRNSKIHAPTCKDFLIKIHLYQG